MLCYYRAAGERQVWGEEGYSGEWEGRALLLSSSWRTASLGRGGLFGGVGGLCSVTIEQLENGKSGERRVIRGSGRVVLCYYRAAGERQVWGEEGYSGEWEGRALLLSSSWRTASLGRGGLFGGVGGSCSVTIEQLENGKSGERRVIRGSGRVVLCYYRAAGERQVWGEEGYSGLQIWGEEGYSGEWEGRALLLSSSWRTASLGRGGLFGGVGGSCSVTIEQLENGKSGERRVIRGSGRVVLCYYRAAGERQVWGEEGYSGEWEGCALLLSSSWRTASLGRGGLFGATNLGRGGLFGGVGGSCTVTIEQLENGKSGERRVIRGSGRVVLCYYRAAGERQVWGEEGYSGEWEGRALLLSSSWRTASLGRGGLFGGVGGLCSVTIEQLENGKSGERRVIRGSGRVVLCYYRAAGERQVWGEEGYSGEWEGRALLLSSSWRTASLGRGGLFGGVGGSCSVTIEQLENGKSGERRVIRGSGRVVLCYYRAAGERQVWGEEGYSGLQIWGEEGYSGEWEGRALLLSSSWRTASLGRGGLFGGVGGSCSVTIEQLENGKSGERRVIRGSGRVVLCYYRAAGERQVWGEEGYSGEWEGCALLLSSSWRTASLGRGGLFGATNLGRGGLFGGVGGSCTVTIEQLENGKSGERRVIRGSGRVVLCYYRAAGERQIWGEEGYSGEWEGRALLLSSSWRTASLGRGGLFGGVGGSCSVTIEQLENGKSGERRVIRGYRSGERRVFTIQSYKSREWEGCALHSSVKCN